MIYTSKMTTQTFPNMQSRQTEQGENKFKRYIKAFKTKLNRK